MRIAILGATGHISRCAVWVFAQNNTNELFLFSRSKKLGDISESIDGEARMYFKEYSEFGDYEYDVIFNGVGIWDTPGANVSDIFHITEKFDDLIIEYQKCHPSCISIHISSGAAYANDFLAPVERDSETKILINDFKTGDFYAIAKMNSEVKHRAQSNLRIVDLRLFGFFSRYMSLEYSYFLSALINASKNEEEVEVVPLDFWRDYISMEDFKSLLEAIVAENTINRAIDVYSTNPVSKQELVDLFVDKYHLKIKKQIKKIEISKTGIKPYYFSRVYDSIYTPKYSALDAVMQELPYFMGEETAV